ncbi:MAG: methyl-accepting chemotaxis protein [Desulfovermiculus sp.]
MNVRLGIQGKILSTLLAAIVVSIVSIAVVILVSVNTNSQDNFKQESRTQLKLVDTYITSFIDSVRENTQLLTQTPSTQNAFGKVSGFLETQAKKSKTPADVGETEKEVMKTLQRMVDTHPAYAVAFLGLKDGGFTMMPADPLPAGYDPRQRSWYQEGMRTTNKTKLTSAYRSTTGEPVSSVVSKVQDIHGRTIGVVGIDVNLKTLTDETSSLKLGKTGYVLLMEDGVILSDPANNNNLFKKANDIGAAYRRIQDTDKGTFEVEMGGTDKLVTVSASQGTGWKLAAIIDKKEVYQAGQSMAINVLLIGLGLAIVFGLVGFIVSRRIATPVTRIVTGLKTSAEQTASASDQVSSSSQSLAEGSNEQASSLEETSSSLEEMSSQTKHTADNASQAEQAMASASQEVEGGVQAMDQMNEAIGKIKSGSEETSKIIKTIDDIAFQTNLLALNAAVEAARAGEAGKGFAVVAEEVRNLAQRSAEAAKNTSELIERSQANAEKGVEVTQDVSDRLHSIHESVSQVDTLVKEIAAAGKEQAQGIEQVNTAVSEMDKVVQQNASDSEETASAAQELSSQAAELDIMIQELSAIVTGDTFKANGMQATEKRSAPLQGKQQTHQAKQIQSRQQGSQRQNKQQAPRSGQTQSRTKQNANRSQSPEKMIPLDDNDFSDF